MKKEVKNKMEKRNKLDFKSDATGFVLILIVLWCLFWVGFLVFIDYFLKTYS